eukprot:4619722-Alexandrium_andersonii.AAC.1
MCIRDSLRGGWGILCSGRRRGPRALQARETCGWIDANGPRLGFRVPTVEELSRVLGMENYFAAY